MKPNEILELVAEMRDAQREYFRTRDYEVLRKSKALEKRVDTELAQLKQEKSDTPAPTTLSLFDNSNGEMDIYINKRTGGYSGGLAVVAARSPQEAHGILMQESEIFDYHYEPDGWQQLPNTKATVAKPQLLAEDGYTE